jgi:hypothetical protein
LEFVAILLWTLTTFLGTVPIIEAVWLLANAGKGGRAQARSKKR